jgi:hypothetical protein
LYRGYNTKDKFPFKNAMSKRLVERSNDFLSALSRLEEALAQPENSFLRDATQSD